MGVWRRNVRAGLLAGVLVPQMAASAFAQEVVAADAQSTRPASAQAEAAGDIVVTATRREERLQDVPIAVTAVRGDELERRGVADPEGLAAISPSLQVQNGAAKSQGNNFSIRGIGTTSFQRTIDSSVAVVIDDVALARTEMGVVNFSDVSQVEVLNGPQGMLFGRNASAGLVHIRTTDPIMGETSGRFFAEYGRLNTGNDTNLFRINGTANLEISPDAATRVNVFVRENSPIMRNVLSPPDTDLGLHQVGGSAKFLWRPTASVSVLLAGDYMHSVGLNTGVSSFRSSVLGSSAAAINAGVGITAGPKNTKVGFDASTFDRSDIGGGQLKIEADLSADLTLTNIAAARFYSVDAAFDGDGLPVNLFDSFTEPKNFRQFSNELRIASAPGRTFDYQFGVYALKARIRQSNLLRGNLGMVPPPGVQYLLANAVDQVQHVGSYAGFGQGTLRLNDAVRLIAGARLTYDEVEMRYTSDGLGAPIQVIPVANSPTVKRNNTDLSWRGTVQFNATRDEMLYATIARGYKGPGFSQFSTTYVRPETSRHYEVGVKSQFADRRITLNLAAYYTAFRDFQAQAVDASTLTIFVQNAGKLETKGFEVQLNARPIEGLTVSGGLAFADATFADFKGDICYTGQPDCIAGKTDSTGRRLPNAPKWSGNLSVRYEHDLTAGLVGSVGSALSSRSSVNYSSNGDPNTVQKGYATLDLDVGLGTADRSWNLTVFCRNCTDQRFAGFIQAAFAPSTDYRQQFAQGSFRSVGLSLDHRF